MKAFLFSGQGAQSPGMMKDIYCQSLAAKAVFDTADKVLGRSISGLCFDGTQEDLNLTHNTQPCMLAVDLAAYASLIEYGIRADVIAGFSLGEYAALVAAQVISIEEAFIIVQLRADAMQDAVPVGKGAMAAIMKISTSEVEALCNSVDGYVVAANFNSPGQTVVSGEVKAVDSLLTLTKEKKIRAIKLPVSAPFHCKLMQPARQKLSKAFGSISFKDAIVPIYMNVDGKAHTKGNEIKTCVLQQTVSPVQWVSTIEDMNQVGVTTFIELGAGKTLSGFVSKILNDVSTLSVTDAESLDTTLLSLGVR